MQGSIEGWPIKCPVLTDRSAEIEGGRREPGSASGEGAREGEADIEAP
eukprot:SAG31_NODE_11956_length_982_cov_1.330691_1_plen_47_part_10